jgi:hypothetical protein
MLLNVICDWWCDGDRCRSGRIRWLDTCCNGIISMDVDREMADVNAKKTDDERQLDEENIQRTLTVRCPPSS